MSCCDEAATYLIEAFGGEEVMKQTVGGTKWWQVRGIKGCVMCSLIHARTTSLNLSYHMVIFLQFVPLMVLLVWTLNG